MFALTRVNDGNEISVSRLGSDVCDTVPGRIKQFGDGRMSREVRVREPEGQINSDKVLEG